MKKTISVIGIVVGLVMFITGVISLGISLNHDSRHVTAADSTYDIGYAQFGSDYYSYSNNNMAHAGVAATRAAANIYELADLTEGAANLMKVIGGVLLMGLGLLGSCGFGIIFAGCLEEEKKQTALLAAEQPVEEVVVAE